FQQTVSQGISESYLRWRGIEATLQLSQSTNAKVVVIGSGKDGLPIILGNVDTPAPLAGTTPPSGTHPTNKANTPAARPAVPRGCRAGGAVGENARCRLGHPDRKDCPGRFGQSGCRSSRAIALVLAAQSL